MNAPLIRRFAPGDEAGIRDLYRVAFELELTLEEWRWYYAHGAIILVAEVEQRIVGHYAVQPRPFHIGERRCEAGLVIGSMVAPQFRNVTTFVDLAKQAYAACRERGIAFVYAFPNDNVWLVRRRMLGWSALPSLVALAAPTARIDVAADTSAIEMLPRNAAFPAANRLDAGTAGRIRAAQPVHWLDWRLRGHPSVEYPVYIDRSGGRLRGYIALKRYDKDGASTGHIVAFRVEPGAEATSGAALLARAKSHFEAARIDRVSLWLLPASPLHELVVRAGFEPEPGRGKNFGYLALEDGLEPTLSDAAAWDVTMSDSDVF